MTKRDAQAREYAAESYEKTPAERGVSHMSWALTDEERAAIECFAKAEWTNHRWSKVEKYSTALRNLLERTK